MRRFSFSLALAALLACAGCETLTRPVNPRPKRYWQVRVENPRGEFIAEWIAEGGVWKTERGYRFRAVQRTSAPPNILELHYPHGRQVEIAGPNIIAVPCGKPEWLVERDGL